MQHIVSFVAAGARSFRYALLPLFIVVLQISPAGAEETGISVDVQKILMLPESKIDVGIAALTFSKEIYPEIDVDNYSKKIDALADEVKALTRGRSDPDYQIRALNTVLYLREGYGYDKSAEARDKTANYFISGTLDTKHGTCISLPMLYMAVAQRLGLPVYPVEAPEHLFLRNMAPGMSMPNIEATEGGGYSSDSTYIRDFKITDKGVSSGAYMRTMTYREFLGVLLEENGVAFAKMRQRDRAIKYFEVAAQLNPHSIVAAENLRISYDIKRKQASYAFDSNERTAALREYTEKVAFYEEKTKELGFTRGETQ